MNCLAIECSAGAASVALTKDGVLVAQYFQNNGKTHSRTLLPMIQSMLETCEWTLADVNVIAVAAGPGSFTGLRIGISVAKGLAWQGDLKCCGVSTLEAMAHPLAHMEGVVLCPVMDARRDQVYNALFSAKGGALLRMREDRAIGLADLLADLNEIHETIVLVGDGASLVQQYAEAQGRQLTLPPTHLRVQSAWGVACAARSVWESGDLVSPEQLQPSYLRLSQAERERLARMQQDKTGVKKESD